MEWDWKGEEEKKKKKKALGGLEERMGAVGWRSGEWIEGSIRGN